MKHLLVTASLIGLLAAGPAYAIGDLENNNTNTNTATAHGGAGGAGGAGGHGGSAYSGAISGSKSKANAASRSSARQGQAQGQQQGQGQSQGQVSSSDQGQSQDDSTDIEGSWGFSYVDIPVTVPQAVATPDVAILSDSWKFGPVFGHSSQETEALPDGILKTYRLVLVARGVAGFDADGKFVVATGQENFGYESAFAMETALCAKDPAVARQLLYSCVD